MSPIFRLFTRLHARLFRATGGRVGASVGGGEVLLLTTTGRKSGAARTVPVMCFDHGGDKVVIASAGGSAEHPAWFRNLAAKPEVTVEARGDRYAARAEVVSGEERAAIWREVIAAQPRFAGYQEKAGGREIPVVRLRRT